MDHTTYLFIDGNYAQRIHREAMEAVFGHSDVLDAAKVASVARSFRTYYYDCPDDLKKESERDDEFKARKAAQDHFFARVRSLPGVHLQLGTLRGQRRRSQKEVDVLLAVDMLTHGFNKNMTKAVLFAGDLDFRPIVEALVRSGIYVEIWYAKKSAASELHWAADFGLEIGWSLLWQFTSDAFQAGHRLPSETNAHGSVPQSALLRAGTLPGGKLLLLQDDFGPFVIRYEHCSGILWMEHDDCQVLTRYFEMRHGQVKWVT